MRIEDEVRLAVQENRRVRPGKDVFIIDEHRIAKTHGNSRHFRRGLRVSEYARKNGCHVPECYGIITIEDILGLEGTRTFAVVERIKGKLLGETKDIERVLAELKLCREIELLLDLGIYPLDSVNPSNSMLQERTGLVYLLDSHMWVNSGKTDIEKYRAFLEKKFIYFSPSLTGQLARYCSGFFPRRH